MKYDKVVRPEHYVKGRKYEPLDVIHDWGLTFCLGNALKYIARAGRKDNEVADLEKARYYLGYEINRLRRKRGPKKRTRQRDKPYAGTKQVNRSKRR